MPTPHSRVTADVRRIELIALKVHVKSLPPVEHLDGVRKLHALRILCQSDHLRKLPPIASCLEKLYDPIMSGEYMSEPRFKSQLSLCPGGTYTSPADRACDRFAIYTQHARYFAFSQPTCFGSLVQ